MYIVWTTSISWCQYTDSQHFAQSVSHSSVCIQKPLVLWQSTWELISSHFSSTNFWTTANCNDTPQPSLNTSTDVTNSHVKLHEKHINRSGLALMAHSNNTLTCTLQTKNLSVWLVMWSRFNPHSQLAWIQACSSTLHQNYLINEHYNVVLKILTSCAA